LWEQVAPLAGRKPAASTAAIVTAPYPQAELQRVDADADAWMAKLKAVAGACRQLRSEMNLSPAERVPLLASGDADFIASAAPVLKALARLSELRSLTDADFDEATRSTPVAVQGEARLALLVAIDVEAESARLSKEMARIEAEIGKAALKLDNPSFVARAPAAVVGQERQRLDDFRRTLDRLRDQASRLRSSP
jgi:valyl-tRNA synthetase